MRYHRNHLRTFFACLAAGAALGAVTHPEATLKSDVKAVRVGEAWPVRGEKFAADQKVQLALQGALSEYKLREVLAAGDGTFALSLEIPREVRPGAYRLVAIADDGDAVATLDVTIEPVSPAEMPEHEMTHGGAEARADDLPIQRSRSGAEWGAIGLLVGFAGGIGLSLLRRRA